MVVEELLLGISSLSIGGGVRTEAALLMHVLNLSLWRKELCRRPPRRCKGFLCGVRRLVGWLNFGAPLASVFTYRRCVSFDSGLLTEGWLGRDACARRNEETFRGELRGSFGRSGYVAVNCIEVSNGFNIRRCAARWREISTVFGWSRRHCSSLAASDGHGLAQPIMENVRMDTAQAVEGSQCRSKSEWDNHALHKRKDKLSARMKCLTHDNRKLTSECNGELRSVRVSVAGYRDALRLRWLRCLLLLLQPLTSEQRNLLQLLRSPYGVTSTGNNGGEVSHDALRNIHMPQMQHCWKLIPILHDIACFLKQTLDEHGMRNTEVEMCAKQGSWTTSKVCTRIQHYAAKILYFLPTMSPALTSQILLKVSQIERILSRHSKNLWREVVGDERGDERVSVTEVSLGDAEWDVLMLRQCPPEKLLHFVFAASALHLTDSCLRSYQASDLAVLLQALAIHMGSPRSVSCSIILNKWNVTHPSESSSRMQQRERSLVLRACNELLWKITDASLEEVVTAASAIAALGITDRKVYIHLTHRLAEIILVDRRKSGSQPVRGKTCHNRQLRPVTDAPKESINVPVCSKEMRYQSQHSQCRPLDPERQVELLALMAKALASIGHDDLPFARILLLYIMDMVDKVSTLHPLQLNRPEQDVFKEENEDHNPKCPRVNQQAQIISSRTLSNVAFFVTRYLTLQQQKAKQQRLWQQGHFSNCRDRKEVDDGADGFFLTNDELILVGETLLVHAHLPISIMQTEHLCTTMRLFATVTAVLHNNASNSGVSSPHSEKIIRAKEMYLMHHSQLLLLKHLIQGLLQRGFERLSDAAMSNVLHGLLSLSPVLSEVSGSLNDSRWSENRIPYFMPKPFYDINSERATQTMLQILHELRLECVARCVYSLVTTARSTGVFALMLQNAEAAVDASVSRSSSQGCKVSKEELHSLTKIRDALCGPPVRRQLSHARSGSKHKLECLLNRINESICVAARPVT